MQTRNYKLLSSNRLLMALNAANLSKVHSLEHADEIHGVIVQVMVAALDLVAPAKATTIKIRSSPFHLRPDTLRTTTELDLAAARGAKQSSGSCAMWSAWYDGTG